MEAIHALLNQISTAPPEIWQMLLAGLLASPLVQVIKKWIDAHDHQVEIILVVIALIASLVVYKINRDPLFNNWFASIIAQMGLVGLTAKPFYYIFIKGVWQGLIGKKWNEAAELEQEIKSAAIPAGGLPIAGTSVSAETSQAHLHAQIVEDDFNV